MCEIEILLFTATLTQRLQRNISHGPRCLTQEDSPGDGCREEWPWPSRARQLSRVLSSSSVNGSAVTGTGLLGGAKENEIRPWTVKKRERAQPEEWLGWCRVSGLGTQELGAISTQDVSQAGGWSRTAESTRSLLKRLSDGNQECRP